MPAAPKQSPTFLPIFVALAAWILPGAGYLLIKQRTRGITIGITVLALFFLGLLIGGVRCLEVPGYNAHGTKMFVYYEVERDQSSPPGADGEDARRLVPHVGELPTGNTKIIGATWTFAKSPMNEIRSKPWSIAQIMLGPIDLLCDAWSVYLGQPDPTLTTGERLGARSHSRVNELGVLFTAVAGMLNLLAIIDSSHRASHAEAE